MAATFRKDLERSGITVRQAKRAGMVHLKDASEACEDFSPVSALLIPYFTPGGDMVLMDGGDMFCRVRYLETGGRKLPRYSQPKKSGCRAYFPVCKGITWTDVVRDPTVPIVITEGEKKALRGCLAGVPTIGLGGVYNFLRDGDLLPELHAIDWKDRPTFIAFDSDASLNPHIQAAEGRLATELGIKRGATLFLARTPEIGPSSKAGIDDYIVHFGEDEWLKVLEDALPMSNMEKAVASLNQNIAYIEEEQMVYDLHGGFFLRKDSLVKGSKYSALKVMGVDAKGKSRQFSVPDSWLTHPHARRYDKITFNPKTQDRVIPLDGGGLALNLWAGWGDLPQVTDKDVEPFMRLNEYVLSQTDDEVADLPLKLMIYLAQNPGEKIPLALWFVGLEGSGKSLWARVIREAFSPYGVPVAAGGLAGPYDGWKEKSLIATVDEVHPRHLEGSAKGNVWNAISESKQTMTEKYRPTRQIDTSFFMIFTSNQRGVVAFSADDRRNIVVDCPQSHPQGREFYGKVHEWLRGGGARKLLAWMLQQDLGGWRPPSQAPMTAEKHMAYMEALTPIQRLAEEFKSAQENTIYLWLQESLRWAQSADVAQSAYDVQRAAEIRAAVPRFQIRPWYTAEEISLIFPAISSALFGVRGHSGPVAGRISKELREAGVTYLRNLDDPRGFRVRGRLQQYLVMYDTKTWGRPVTQAEFDQAMGEFPTFKQYMAAKRKKG